MGNCQLFSMRQTAYTQAGKIALLWF